MEVLMHPAISWSSIEKTYLSSISEVRDLTNHKPYLVIVFKNKRVLKIEVFLAPQALYLHLVILYQRFYLSAVFYLEFTNFTWYLLEPVFKALLESLYLSLNFGYYAFLEPVQLVRYLCAHIRYQVEFLLQGEQSVLDTLELGVWWVEVTHGWEGGLRSIL